MEKNAVAEIRIEDMTEQGEGIGKADGFPLFVKDTVVGDVAEVRVVKVKKGYGYGRLLRVLEPSPQRVIPRCPVAGPCGGCQLQAMSYESQLAFKRRKVANHLGHLGGFAVSTGEPSGDSVLVKPVIGMEDPWEYRNKCQIPVSRGRDGRIVMGFYAGRTHSVIETGHCFLGSPVNDQILGRIRDHMSEYGIDPYDEQTGKGLVRHVLIRTGKRTGEIMVCLVINGRRLPRANRLVQALCDIDGMTSVCLNVNTSRTNVILGEELIHLYGPGVITDRIGEVEFQISPLSFFQVNPLQTERLYRKALECAGLTGRETVWDLYCGTGTISLFLAQKAKQVYGVEIIPAAVENARANAQRNGIRNAEFFVGKAEEVLPAHYEQVFRESGERLHADVIVVDPPRKGCDGALLSTMLKMQPRRIVYVSCNSATLARDLKILCGDGRYRLDEVQPVDMFPQTTGVEVVCALSKLSNAKHHVNKPGCPAEKVNAIEEALRYYQMV